MYEFITFNSYDYRRMKRKLLLTMKLTVLLLMSCLLQVSAAGLLKIKSHFRRKMLP